MEHQKSPSLIFYPAPAPSSTAFRRGVPSAESLPCFFLKKIDHHLEAHYADRSLSVGKLLALTHMSRTDLHRKMKEAVGMSATEYMRLFRLRKAMALIRAHPGLSMAEVASAVGFCNQGYFCRRFKELAGVSPGKWR